MSIVSKLWIQCLIEIRNIKTENKKKTPHRYICILYGFLCHWIIMLCLYAILYRQVNSFSGLIHIMLKTILYALNMESFQTKN